MKLFVFCIKVLILKQNNISDHKFELTLKGDKKL